MTQFSDTTNKNGLIQLCEMYTGLGDANISGNAILLKQFTGLINQSYEKIVTMILDSQDEWDFDDANGTDYPVLTTPLTTNRDYPLPASIQILKIKRMDISYDGASYNRAEPFDIGESPYGFGNDTTVDGRFSRSSPRYDIQGQSLWLYPKATSADVTAGGIMRITISRYVSEFASSDTTKKPGIDLPFHNMLAIEASYQWMLGASPEKCDRIKKELLEYESRLRTYFGSKDSDRRMVMVHDAGQSYS